ncbi:MAG: NADP-dependent oxidoreductase [Rhodospirillaceae bacterium]|nr:NADP-dependent oxidoreductase [Rhodospirillaceae bacterium]
MSANANRALVLKEYPVGAPGPEHFEIVESPLPEPGAGEILIRSIYLTVDPYMRGRLRPGPSYAEPQKIGEVMIGEVAGEVVASQSDRFAVGDYVKADIGWQTHGIANAERLRKLDPKDASISTSLGVLGMPGLTAYFGTLEVLIPRAGDTLLVNAASGAVGSVVGQIGKIAGCRVVGVAGSDEKCDFITRELGFDAAINHRTTDDMSAAMRDACPDGIDCYFDNVGGPISDAAFENLAMWARVGICGQIAQYNDTEQAMGPRNLRHFLVKRASLRGLLVFDWQARYHEGLDRLTRWVQEGRIKYREDIIQGLENAPGAFAGLMEGKNFGKQLVKIGDDPTR